MAEDKLNPLVGRVFDIAHTFATPFAQSLLGDRKSTPMQQGTAELETMIRNDALNGSGPADPTLAAESAPRTILDDIVGDEPSREEAIGQPDPMQPMALIFILLVVGWFLFKKR